MTAVARRRAALDAASRPRLRRRPARRRAGRGPHRPRRRSDASRPTATSCRSSCSPRWTPRPTPSRAWRPAPTTTSPSRSASPSCAAASAPSCGACTVAWSRAACAFGHVTLDRELRRVTVDGEPVKLTFSEFELLGCLMARPGTRSTARSCCARSGVTPPTATRARSTSTSATCARSSKRPAELPTLILTVPGPRLPGPGAQMRRRRCRGLRTRLLLAFCSRASSRCASPPRSRSARSRTGCAAAPERGRRPRACAALGAGAGRRADEGGEGPGRAGEKAERRADRLRPLAFQRATALIEVSDLRHRTDGRVLAADTSFTSAIGQDRTSSSTPTPARAPPPRCWWRCRRTARARRRSSSATTC